MGNGLQCNPRECNDWRGKRRTDDDIAFSNAKDANVVTASMRQSPRSRHSERNENITFFMFKFCITVYFTKQSENTIFDVLFFAVAKMEPSLLIG